MAKFTQSRMYEMLGDITKPGKPCPDGFQKDPVTGDCISIREKVEDIQEMPRSIVQKPPYYQESFVNPAAYVSGYRGGDPRMYKYGFLDNEEGQIIGGGGFGFPKPGVHLNALGVVPTSSNDRQYFKGAYEAGISKDFKNLNLGLGVNTAITGYPGDNGFVRDPIKLQPKLNLKYNFAEGGALNKFSNGGEHCPKGEYWNGTNCVPGINPESDWFKLTDTQKRLLEKGNNLATVENWYKESPEQMEMFKAWIDEHDAETYLNQLDPDSNQSKKFKEALDNDRQWNQEWYTKRKTLPQFKDVAERRLAINNQDMVSALKDPINLSMDWWKTHPSKFSNIPEVFYAPEIGAITRDNIADYNTDPQGYVEASYYTDANGRLQNSTITHEELHIRDHLAPQKNTTDHIKRSEWNQPLILDPLQKIITAEEALSDPRNNGYAGTYQQQPTEFRARLNVWRKKNGIDPLKNYTEEELKSIIDTNLQDPNLDHQIKELYETIKSDPSKLKFVHDSYVSNDSNKDLDTAEYGGLHKFITGGASNQCPIGEYWNGTKCVPNYGVNPLGQSAINNFVNNTITGVNSNIASAQRKGMAYQSTADELNVLYKQKEKLKADEAKRKALEAEEYQRQQHLRRVGSDNTRVDKSIVKNNAITIQDPFVQAESITKAQKDAARQLISSGDFAKHFPEKFDYYLSRENSNREGGPLTMEELALEQIRTNPDFFKTLEERKYKDFQNREQKMYDEMPWYIKGINLVNSLASDPITTLERGILEWERPLAFQGLQSTDPSIVGDDARFYDKVLNRDENVLNNTLNYINPFRAASSAGQNLQQGDYGDAVVDFATIIPILKGAKLGVKGLNAAMRVSPATLLKGAGSNILANASPLVQATANKATVGNLLTLYGGYEAGAHNFPNAFDAYGKGDWKTGNKELFTGIAMGTPLALEMGAGKVVAKGVQGAKGLYNDVATGNSFIPYAWKNPAAALDAESSTAMFDKIIQSDNFTNAEKALIKEYQYSSTPFVSAGAKQDQFNALIQKATLEFPNDAVITRAFAGAGDFDSAIGTAGDFKSFSLQGRPSAFSAGTSAKGKYYYANQDRIVLSGKNLKKLEGNFVKNNYEALPEGYYGDVAAEDLAVNDFSKQLSKNIASGSREIQPFDSVGSSYYGTSRLSESEIAAQADAVYAAKAKHYSNLPDHYYQNPDGKVFLENGSAVTSEEAVQMAADHNLGIKKEIDLFTNPARKEEALQSIIKHSQEKAFSASPGPVDELELMGSGFDLKTVGKFKNKHGGTDYVVQPRNIKTQSNNTTTLEANSSSKRIPYNAEKNQNTAIIIEQLRNDRYLKINSPEGKIRIEELIANNPHMKNMTYEDVKNGFANMANENAMQTSMEEEFALLTQRIKNLELNPNANQSQIQRLKTQASKLEGDILFGEEAIEAKTLNAHMMRATTKVANDSDAIVLTRPNAKGARKDAMPSDIYSILASPELTVEDLSRIVPHEFGHYFQQGAKTNLDKMLSNISLKTNSSSLNSNLFSNEEGISNFYNKLMGKSDPFKSMSKYWRRGGNGQEKTAFMEEVRADMLQRGMIEDLYQTITPELLQEHYVKYMGEVGNKYPLRIYEIMNNNSGNFNIMSEVLNKMPAVVPIGVGGAGMMMMQNNEENSVPKQKRGGNIKTLSKFIRK